MNDFPNPLSRDQLLDRWAIFLAFWLAGVVGIIFLQRDGSLVDAAASFAFFCLAAMVLRELYLRCYQYA